MAVKQTAGRDSLGEFAPKFAELNDDEMCIRDSNIPYNNYYPLILIYCSMTYKFPKLSNENRK